MQRKNFYAGGIASISAKFYKNGILFNPYSVSDVNIYNASVSGTLITTIVPSSSQVGVYVADWHISSGTVAGTYYDQWTWQGDQSINPQTVTYSISVLSYNNPPTVYTPPLPKKQRGPLFVGHREIDFFNHIGKELIQRIIDQKVIYYSVSEEHTKSHKLYDEAITKTVFTPVEINALILYKEPTQTNTQFSIDTIYSIEVYFHLHELEERNIIPREGDFTKWGNVVYEIQKITYPQIVYGQVQNKVMAKLECSVARQGQFQVLDDIKTYDE